MVTTKTAMGEEQFKLYEVKEYPNPQSIPRPPSTYEPKPQVALADLKAKSYVKIVAEQYISRQLNVKINWEPK